VPKALSTGAETSRREICGRIAGKAPDGVGRFAASRVSALRGRKARKTQKNIQAKSTPRSVQDKIICEESRVADGFMGTSFLQFTIFSSYVPEITSRTMRLLIFQFVIIILDEAKL
jgi:hypothetical protein